MAALDAAPAPSPPRPPRRPPKRRLPWPSLPANAPAKPRKTAAAEAATAEPVA
jgi:hypothetical protein